MITSDSGQAIGGIFLPKRLKKDLKFCPKDLSFLKKDLKFSGKDLKFQKKDLKSPDLVPKRTKKCF